MTEENEITNVLKKEKDNKIKESTDNTREEIYCLIDENIELVYEDYNNTKEGDEEQKSDGECQLSELIDKKRKDEVFFLFFNFNCQ
jgi:hypothetical protein